jgi:hypothetical protein
LRLPPDVFVTSLRRRAYAAPCLNCVLAELSSFKDVGPAPAFKLGIAVLSELARYPENP